ncbi:MAG TPA: PLP-dependent aminotransferase family protein [Candidatus Coproplasma excrementigallinarum]|uniref:PLP-dependent aminotransferase family protein n=1 Tax=Candidatus Coproplasma excrementigallinarum TaxID=2840747 RepID=A0A9D1SIV5_9FIRM|nr:PLP-dependent aminotransferase family protein [Candidatus Coproplasma excrementigallinarum]
MYPYDLSGKNKYYTLYENLRRDILRGKLKSGEKLPSKRTLAAELGVSVVTVQTAFDQLLAEGYISSRERSGYYVCKVELDYREQPEPALRPYEEKKKQVGTDFVSGSTPAELFPFSSWARLLREVLSDCGEHLLERVPSAGDAELRGAISDYLYRARGLYADPERIIIGAGAEQLYGVIVQLVGREKLFAAENPCYRKIYDSYTLNGARCTLLPVGREGVSAADVEQSGASVVHISPAHQYPTGAVMPAAARARIISAVQKRDGYVVEDDYDSEFRLYGKPLQSMYALAPERVIYVNTFSKTLAPSMRMGYMVLPQSLYKRYTELFGHNSSAVPLFEQKALARMISGGGFERHLSRLKNYYRGVREVLFKKLSSLKYEHIIQDSGGGLHFTVKFPAAQTDGQIKEMAAGADIRVRTLSDYLILPAAGFEKTVVVNYSGVTLAKAEALDLSVI